MQLPLASPQCHMQGFISTTATSQDVLKNNYDPNGGWAISLYGYSMIIENNIILTDPRALVSGYDAMYASINSSGIVRNNVAFVGTNGITTSAGQTYNNIASRFGSFPVQ